jgi:hypothetical protein
MHYARLTALLLSLSGAAAAQGQLPPEVGEIAPPIGRVRWVQVGDEDEGYAPELAALRGHVVIVHTYGHYCDPCVRVAVPLVKRLRTANSIDELRIVSLTGMIVADEEETPGIKARELGIEHAVGVAGMFGERSPYLNMNKMPGLTYAYVIARSGGVAWKGDPSREIDEFLEALQEALAAPRGRAVPEGKQEELADAVAEYVTGDLAKARKLADKVGVRFGKKKGEEAAAIAERARALVEAVDGTLEDLSSAFDVALEAADAESTARSLSGLRATFPKSDQLSAATDRLRANAELSTSVDAWSAWLELEQARPPAFPERREKVEKRYARELEKYLKKSAEGPGHELVAAWLERYAAAD